MESSSELCGDGFIILGKEEEHRRTTSSLAEYMTTFPNLGPLEPEERYRSLRLWPNDLIV